MKALKELEPLEDMEAQQEAEDKRLKQWARLVGEDRARAALELARTRSRKRTLPELLAERWLMDRGMRYRAQYPLIWARPDFVIWGAQVAGALVWEIQGEYWHGASVGKDKARKEKLLQSVIEGMPVMAVVELWEKDIYQNESVFSLALQGVSNR